MWNYIQILLRFCQNHVYSHNKDIPIVLGNWTMYITIYSSTVMFLIIVMIIHIIYPIVSSTSQLPTTTMYPFPLSSKTVKLLYLHQVLSLMQVPVIIVVDGMLLMMIIISIVELERLKIMLKKSDSYTELLNCIRRHQRIVWWLTIKKKI